MNLLFKSATFTNVVEIIAFSVHTSEGMRATLKESKKSAPREAHTMKVRKCQGI